MVSSDMMRKILHEQEKHKKQYKEDTETIISSEGEILEKKVSKSFITEREPDFVKVYLDTIMVVNGLPDALKNTLNALLKVMSYKNVIILNSYIKKQIADELGYKSVQSLNNNISKLTKSGVIEWKGTGTYRMNPFLFGRGSWEDVKSIRYEIVFGESGIQQKANFEYAEDDKK